MRVSCNGYKQMVLVTINIYDHVALGLCQMSKSNKDGANKDSNILFLWLYGYELCS
jgi:hypothetical protein